MTAPAKPSLIACLGWGSLVWEPRELPILRRWFEDGPFVHVDFLRKSDSGRVTLVLHETAWPIRSCWATMGLSDLDSAKTALATREGTLRKGVANDIASWSRGDPSPTNIRELPTWAEAHALDSVIWTNLPPKWEQSEGGKAGNGVLVEHSKILDYLASLTGPSRDLAEEYVRRAPRQTDTQLRRLIEARFGWTPTDA